MNHEHELIACLHEADIKEAQDQYNEKEREYEKKRKENPSWDPYYIYGPRTAEIKPMWWVCKKCDKILEEPTGLKTIKVMKNDPDEGRDVCEEAKKDS